MLCTRAAVMQCVSFRASYLLADHPKYADHTKAVKLLPTGCHGTGNLLKIMYINGGQKINALRITPAKITFVFAMAVSMETLPCNKLTNTKKKY